MDEDELKALRQELDDESDYRSVHFLYQEGFELPDSLKSVNERNTLQRIIRRISHCVDYMDKHLLSKKRFATIFTLPRLTPTELEELQRRKRARRRAKRRKNTESSDTAHSSMTGGSLMGDDSDDSLNGDDEDDNENGDRKRAKRTGQGGTTSLASDDAQSCIDTQRQRVATTMFGDHIDETVVAPPTAMSTAASDDGSVAGEPEARVADETRHTTEEKRDDSESGDNGGDDETAVVLLPPAPERVAIEDEFRVVEHHDKVLDIEADELVTQREMLNMIFLEVQCMRDLCNVLESYRMEHANDLMEKIVYYSAADKRNKNMTFFEELFLIICKCQCMIAVWNSAHEPRVYERRATDFEFARRAEICVETKRILDYTVKDILCAINTLSEGWLSMDYCVDLERYVDLLKLRTAMLVSHTSDRSVHDMPRYRKFVGVDPATNVEMCVGNYDFVTEMSAYFFSYNKRMRLRNIFNTATLYDLDVLFNQRSSYRLIAWIGVDTNSLVLSHDVAQVNYESNLYAALPGPGSAVAAKAKGDVRQMAAAIVERDKRLYGAQKRVGEAVGNKDDADKAPPPLAAVGDDQVLEELRRHTANVTIDLRLHSVDQFRVAYFLNDETFKFLSRPDLPFKVFTWLQERAVKLNAYGEETMRTYRKMCLHYSVMIGEDLIYHRNPKGRNKAIEEVLKVQRGIKVFNKMQENLNKDPHKILPDIARMFEATSADYDERKINTILSTRNPTLYRRYAEKVAAGEHDDNDGAGDVKKRLLTDHTCRRSATSHHLPDNMDSPDCIYRRIRLSAVEELLCILLIDSYFENYFQTSFEAKYTIYEKELEAKYDSYSRSKMPMLVQTTNGFNVAYLETIFEVSNLVLGFYLWLRLVDQFHARSVNGYDVSRIYGEVFGSEKNYRKQCHESLASMIVETAKEPVASATKDTETPTRDKQAPTRDDEEHEIELCF